MSTHLAEELLLENARNIILGKFRANSLKTDWIEGLSNSYIMERLQEEMNELCEAIKEGHNSKIVMECADVIGYGLMLIHNHTYNHR